MSMKTVIKAIIYLRNYRRSSETKFQKHGIFKYVFAFFAPGLESVFTLYKTKFEWALREEQRYQIV